VLLQFSFKNYKSFRDDTTLDLTATKISEYNNHVVSIANERVLPVAAIFGANASGKSNVQEAFRYMATYVLQSLNYGGDETSALKKKSVYFKPTPFLFDAESKTAESSFEVYFMDSEENGAKTYNYGFSVNNIGVCEEWLNVKTKSSRGTFKPIFYRKGNELDLSGIPSMSQDNLKIALEKETLVVSLGAKLKISKLKHIRDWFVYNEVANFGQPVENLVLSQIIPSGFADDKTVQQRVVQYFSSFDPSIIDFNVEVLKSTDEETDHIKIEAIHRIIGSNKTASIPLEHESAGTLKMFALYPMLQFVLSTGGVLFIDELNARLHPLLVRTFVITFLNADINIKHAQLVFTTHDSWQLNSNMLRRDEIWFTEKNDDGVSTLYSLADFIDEDGYKIRKDENYEKNYLLGKYGAIPTLKYFDMFKEEK
jgi:AAA15 family ATPase/GTPase